jgi:hypothetical protein
MANYAVMANGRGCPIHDCGYTEGRRCSCSVYILGPEDDDTDDNVLGVFEEQPTMEQISQLEGQYRS